MASLSRQDLEKLAQLAALELADDELSALGADLEQILHYVAQLEKVDTRGVAPLSHPTVGLVRERPDEVNKLLTREEVLANAPRLTDGMFQVPAVLDGEDG